MREARKIIKLNLTTFSRLLLYFVYPDQYIQLIFVFVIFIFRREAHFLNLPLVCYLCFHVTGKKAANIMNILND